MDAVKLVQSLDADEIRTRLAELEGEQQALRTLLRAAQRRQQALPEPKQQEGRADSLRPRGAVDDS